ncbi:hypothetical protein RHS04_08125 [Rhizoctonia solani]|uniref:Uncharacterized protein n=1 Tax=Rhizoctonia solani TaxID=456999 RepID=A0A8H7H2R9_9AGAM|nr:hypothetical protein RHS04_08125 [Rhizoctonia solani]
MTLDWASIDSLGLKTKRKPMVFNKEWGTGDVFKWYTQLEGEGPESVLVSRLQIRNTGGKIPHRFVVAFLRGGKVVRFDRRPLTKKPGTLFAETLGAFSSRKAADQYEELEGEKLKEIDNSEREIDLKMPSSTSLLHIISACFSLSQDPQSVHYELLKYNCYFFSWSIVMIVTRHTHAVPRPEPHGMIERFNSKLDCLVEFVMDRILKALLQFVTETVSTFRAETGRKLDKGLGRRELLVWKLPIWAVNWVLGLALQFRFRFGLEETLKRKIKATINTHVRPVLEQVLEMQDTVAEGQIRRRLWINDFSEDFQALVQGSVLKVLWSAVLDTLVEGYNGIDGEQLIEHFKSHPKLRYRLKYRLSGNNVIQFTQIWNDALNAALLAARDRFRELDNMHVIPDIPEQMHEMVFDEVFNAGCSAARSAAEAVVAKTREQINSPTRDQMWQEVWDAWDRVWGLARPKCREVAIGVINEGLKEITEQATLVIMEEYHPHTRKKKIPRKKFGAQVSSYNA